MITVQMSEDNIPQFPLPARELDALKIFVGNWHTEGYIFGAGKFEDNANPSALKWIGEESYEWMYGNYFLVHRWNAKVGGGNVNGLEIIGYDVAKKEYFSRMFDQGGNATKYKVSTEGDTWKFNEPFTRITLVFSDHNNTITCKWEWRQEGGEWLPLSNRRTVRVA